MNIAVVAPEKYAFQDLVCVYLLLRLASAELTHFVAEPSGLEDAALELVLKSERVRVEVQVKGSKERVSLGTLANCLVHFPPHKAENALIERLVASGQTFALLVFSGRCDDACSAYLVQEDLFQKREPTERDVALLRSSFATANPGGKKDGPLSSRRKKRIKDFVALASEVELADAARRMLVLEQVTSASLEGQCAQVLRSSYRVPEDRLDAAIARLSRLVSESKRTQLNVVPLFHAELRAIAETSLLPPDYVEHGREHDLATLLSQENAVLISGVPRVGKTYTANWLAAHFQGMGYEVVEALNASDAERQLLHNAPRVVFLDDPLGGAHAVPEPERELANIGRLIRRLGPTRKLIVTQARDRLLATSREHSLNSVTTGGMSWVELTEMPTAVLRALWNRLSLEFEVPESLAVQVDNWIGSGQLQLESGCLQHLAAEHHRLNAPYVLEDSLRLARENSRSMSLALASEGAGSVLQGLAISTSQLDETSDTEVAFVIGHGGEKLPSYAPIKGWMTGIGEGSTYRFPSYELPPSLTDEELRRLEALESRRMLVRLPSGALHFSHPYYRAAAENLVDDATSFAGERVVACVERGLFCASPKSARAAARNLDWIYEALRSDITKERIAEIAEKGLNSSFPSVRDICLEFLIRRVAELPKRMKENFTRWADKVSSASMQRVQWVEGEPVIPLPDEMGIVHWSFVGSNQGNSDDVEYLNNSSAEYMSAERMAGALELLEDHPEELTSAGINKALRFSEALIRAKAIEIWLGVARSGDEEIIDLIEFDSHPLIASAMLAGFSRSWRTSGVDRQRTIVDALRTQASNPVVAASLVHDLLLFNRVERFGVNPPWNLFASIFPVVIDEMPLGVHFDSARLYAVVRAASEHLQSVEVQSLCDAWLNLMEKRNRSGLVLNDHLFGVVDIIVLRAGYRNRIGVLNRLIQLKGTAARARVVAELVDLWSELHADEHMLVISMLSSDARDVGWLQAVAMTRRVVPNEIQRRLLPGGVSSLKNPAELITRIDDQLVRRCLSVYMGRPGILSWIALDGANREYWRPVVKAVAAGGDDELFRSAWADLAFDGNGKELAELLGQIDDPNLPSVFDALLEIKCKTSGDYLPEVWAALFARATREQQDLWMDQIAEAAPRAIDDICEAAAWFEGELLSEFMKRMQSDVVAAQFVNQLIKLGIQADIPAEFVTVLQGLIQNSPPRLHKTVSRIQNALTKAGIDQPELMAALEDLRLKLIEAKFASRVELDSELPDWEYATNTASS